MLSSKLARAATRSALGPSFTKSLATAASPVSKSHKVLVVGGGTAGMSIGHQLLRSGKFSQDDIAIVDPAEWHHYQAGWTLVGGGLKNKEELRRPTKDLVDEKIKYYHNGVGGFQPEENTVTFENGDKINYEHLVVVPGVKINYNSIKGLPEALADPSAPVSTIYSYDYCDKAYRTIDSLTKGNAIFTQPLGAIKCAGAPQKVMWLALDNWKRAGHYSPTDASKSDIKITFATGNPSMFAVPKYNVRLEQMRRDRGVAGLFQHDLISINGDTATFARPDGQEQVTKKFDLLHATPKMGPHAFVKDSPIADAAGYVDVDNHTTQHKKYPNIWSAGDASSLPTSKTTAAVTSEAPVLVKNLISVMEGKEPQPLYDGYTSCPLLTEYGKVLLCEFKYGGEPKETFDDWFGLDQGVPRRLFYHLKKDFFPWVYYQSLVKGTWGGPKGWLS